MYGLALWDARRVCLALSCREATEGECVTIKLIKAPKSRGLLPSRQAVPPSSRRKAQVCGIRCFVYQGEVFIDPRKRTTLPKTKEYIKFPLIERLTNIKARPHGELREAVRGVLMQPYL